MAFVRSSFNLESLQRKHETDTDTDTNGRRAPTLEAVMVFSMIYLRVSYSSNELLVGSTVIEIK